MKVSSSQSCEEAGYVDVETEMECKKCAKPGVQLTEKGWETRTQSYFAGGCFHLYGYGIDNVIWNTNPGKSKPPSSVQRMICKVPPTPSPTIAPTPYATSPDYTFAQSSCELNEYSATPNHRLYKDDGVSQTDCEEKCQLSETCMVYSFVTSTSADQTGTCSGFAASVIGTSSMYYRDRPGNMYVKEVTTLIPPPPGGCSYSQTMYDGNTKGSIRVNGRYEDPGYPFNLKGKTQEECEAECSSASSCKYFKWMKWSGGLSCVGYNSFTQAYPPPKGQLGNLWKKELCDK